MVSVLPFLGHRLLDAERGKTPDLKGPEDFGQ